MKLVESKMVDFVNDCINGVYSKPIQKNFSRNEHGEVRDRIEYEPSEDTIYIILWKSVIVKIRIDDGIMILDSCGYETTTTKSRMNAFLYEFANGRVYQENHIWFFRNFCNGTTWEKGKTVEFTDGMEVDLNRQEK